MHWGQQRTSQHDQLVSHAAGQAAQRQQSVHALQHISCMGLAVVGRVVIPILHPPQELGQLAGLQLCSTTQ